MSKEHTYRVALRWTGNTGQGTCHYTAYERSHIVSVAGKPDLAASADPAFRGDAARHNPEELLVAALSSCHMLLYLHLCATAGVVVTAYTDRAAGRMVETPDGAGQFAEVVLHPLVTVADAGMAAQAQALHVQANARCLIARSVNFPVRHQAACQVAGHPGQAAGP